MDSHLVLNAAGISSRVRHENGDWLLIVSGDDWETALAELEAYHRENPLRPTRPADKTAVYEGAMMANFVYVVVIVSVFLLSAQQAFGPMLQPIGRVHAQAVLDGEWWRTVTALTLHLDVGHMIANLAFGSVFGLLAGRVLGGGVAWLVIVIAGAMGNFMNSAIQSPAHWSIGASTAVFAALGLIVAHGLRQWSIDRGTTLRQWSPLVGGVLLLAFTGFGGERTDVGAHVSGFFAGMLLGALACRLPHRWLANRGFQNWTGLAAIALVLSSWGVAVMVAGD